MRKFAILLLFAAACSCFKKSAPESKPSAQIKAQAKAKSTGGNQYVKKHREIGKRWFAGREQARARLKPNTNSGFKTALSGVICDGLFHWVDVPGIVCGNGSTSGFEYLCPMGNTITSPLVFVLDGNGACWGASGSVSCDCQADPVTGYCTNPDSAIVRGIAGLAQSDDGLDLASSFWGPSGLDQQILTGPDSPFDGFNIAALAPCVDDVWAGGNVTRHFTTDTGGHYDMKFNGFSSMSALISKVSSLFPNPSKFAVEGASASGFGMTCSLSKIRNTWPATNMYSLSSSGTEWFVTTIGQDLLSVVFKTWGAATTDIFGNVSSQTCPLDPAMRSPSQFLFSLDSYVRKFIPSVRKSYEDSYYDATLIYFESLMNYPPSGLTYTDGLIAGTSSVVIRNNATDDTAQKSYATALTNNDTQNFGIMNIPLSTGQTLDVGTCITAGSSNTGQNVLRLLNPLGAQVAIDSASCPGGGAHINAVAALTGQYTLRLGCVANTFCSGTVAAHTTGPTNITFSPLSAPAPYTATNTANDTVNYKTAPVYLVEGQTIDMGTCGVDNSIAIGDTFLRLFNPSNVQVASADNGCPTGLGSRLQYTVPALGPRGLYTIRQGCAGSSTCAGFTAYWIIGPTLFKVWLQGDPPNSGSDCHSHLYGPGQQDPACDYETTFQGASLFKDWVRGWMEEAPFTAGWVNIFTP